MDIVFPDNTTEIIDAMRDADGKEVVFYRPSSYPCGTCTQNEVTGYSTDPFCPECSGEYNIKVEYPIRISGHVTWGPIDDMSWNTGGQVYDGTCRIQIKYTVYNLDVVDNCDYIVVDNKELEIRKKIFRGVPTLNRILLDCIESDTKE